MKWRDGWRVELSLVWGVGQIEAAGLADAGVVLRETGNDVLDVLADPIVVVDQALPIDGVFSPSVAWAMPAMMAGSLRSCRMPAADARDMCTTPVVSSTVTNCWPTFLHIFFGAAQAGKNQRLLAGDQMARLSLVEIWTVSLALRSASEV